MRIVAMSLPAPGKLSMSRHSSDTIQLQWTASDAGSSTLLGYKVYVNGIEEGMVGNIGASHANALHNMTSVHLTAKQILRGFFAQVSVHSCQIKSKQILASWHQWFSPSHQVGNKLTVAGCSTHDTNT